jgi:predicted ATPase
MATAPRQHERDDLDEWTKPPFLRRVRIRGYKSIAFCDVALQPLTILVGRNAAGKSNFLDALAFLRDAVQLSVEEALKRRGGIRSILCRSQQADTVSIQIDVGFGERPPGAAYVGRYGLTMRAAGESLASRPFEELSLRNVTHNHEIGFRTQGDSVLWSDSQNTQRNEECTRLGPDPFLRLATAPVPFMALLVHLLQHMGFYNFNPEAIRLLQKPTPGSLLERDGKNLASVIADLKRIDPDSLERVRDYLSAIAEEIEDFWVVRYGEYETVRFRVRSDSADAPLEFDAASMSDGTLRTLATLMAAFQIHWPTGPSVVGIEEPESALHPAAARALVDALQERTHHTQILLTTHSADLLADEELGPSQLLVVRNHNGRTQLTPVDAASREIVRKELHTLADLHRQDQLDLDQADLVRQAELERANGDG